MAKRNVTLLYDCTPEQWASQMAKLEHDLAQAERMHELEQAAIARLPKMPPRPSTSLWPLWMRGGTD